MQSACCPARATDSGPDTAIPIGTGVSGTSNSLARSTWKCWQGPASFSFGSDEAGLIPRYALSYEGESFVLLEQQV